MKKQTFLIPIVALGASLASCGGGSKKPAVQYGVSLNMTEAMNIDNVTATSKKDYDAKISIKDDFTGYCEMPEKLYEVHVDGVLLEEGEQYTYTRTSNNEAKLHIPSKNVTGDIEIYTEAKAQDIEINYAGEKILHDKDKAVVGSSTVIHLSLSKEDAALYSVPDKLTDLSVTCEDAHDEKLYNLTRCCTYEKRDDASAKLTIPAKYNGVVVITGKINITASYHQPTYTIKDGELDHLVSTYTYPVKKGVEYSFKLTAESTSYQIPETLDIRVGNTLLSKEDGDYTITKVTSNAGEESATVKIKADKVVDDIVVSGDGETKPGAPVKYYVGGLYEPTDVVARFGEDFHCTLSELKGFNAPKAEDIRVLIGDKKGVEDWKIPNATGGGIAFNEETQVLTIDESLFTVSSDVIHIAAKSHGLKLLEFYSSYGDWESIEIASNLGYAPSLFEIGEESVPFSIGSDTYSIRIIGFNCDKNYQYENTAGITFEFTSCISQQYFGKSVSGKTNSSYFYKPDRQAVTYQSEMYDYLNTTLYDALPFKKYINKVSKYTVAGSYSEAEVDHKQDKAVESPNYLFPLSLKELKLDSSISGEFDKEGTGKDHDSQYEYYDKANQSLIKTYGGEAVTYWLRSPANVKQPQIYTINTDGHRASAPARGQKLYVAPAFCF